MQTGAGFGNSGDLFSSASTQSVYHQISQQTHDSWSFLAPRWRALTLTLYSKTNLLRGCRDEGYLLGCSFCCETNNLKQHVELIWIIHYCCSSQYNVLFIFLVKQAEREEQAAAWPERKAPPIHHSFHPCSCKLYCICVWLLWDCSEKAQIHQKPSALPKLCPRTRVFQTFLFATTNIQIRQLAQRLTTGRKICTWHKPLDRRCLPSQTWNIWQFHSVRLSPSNWKHMSLEADAVSPLTGPVCPSWKTKWYQALAIPGPS